MANEVIGGAAQGAAAGAPFAAATGGWSIAIGAGIGAIGGFLQSRSEGAATNEQRNRQKLAFSKLQPGAILKLAKRVTPKMRALVAGGIGPGLEQRTAANLARSGFADTGSGEALRDLSYAAPGAIAAKGALQFAQQTRTAQASALLGAPAVGPTPNAILETLAGGLQGGLGTYLALQKAQTAQQQQIATLQRRYPDLRPGNAPTLPPPTTSYPYPPNAPGAPSYSTPRGPLF